MNENNKSRTKSCKFPIFLKSMLVIIGFLIVFLGLDIINITDKVICLSKINFEKYEVVSTIILTIGLFITTYLVQDHAKLKKFEVESFDAMYLLLNVLKNSYFTLRRKDETYFVELKRLKKSVIKGVLTDNDIQFFQMYPFNGYDEVITGYVEAGLIPTSLAEKYIRYKILFGKYVVQYVKNDTNRENTITLIYIQLEKSINDVRKAADKRFEKYIADIEREISDRLNSI